MSATLPDTPEPGPVSDRRIRRIDGMDLLTAGEFQRVADTVIGSNPGMEPELSRRIVAEALAYLTTYARNVNAQIAPSPVVDEGWHALVLHTELYASLCEGLGVGSSTTTRSAPRRRVTRQAPWIALSP